MSEELRKAKWPIKCQILDKDGNIVFEGEILEWKIEHGFPIMQYGHGINQCVGHSNDSFKIKGIPLKMRAIKAEDSGIPKSCAHIWKKYTGFTDSYEYCDICQAKR